jgi:hypothetical protein
MNNMLRNFFAVSIIVLFVNSSLLGQKNKIRFHSINSFAMVSGETGTSTAFQTVNGIKFLNWFSGIGVGIDNYKYKTLPLFFDARKYFGIEKKVFVHGDIGYDFPMKDKPGKEMSDYDTYHFRVGLYSEFGIGFETKFIKSSSVSFNVAFSSKQLQNRIGIQPLCLGCDPYWYNYKLNYGRILVKTGVEF